MLLGYKQSILLHMAQHPTNSYFIQLVIFLFGYDRKLTTDYLHTAIAIYSSDGWPQIGIYGLDGWPQMMTTSSMYTKMFLICTIFVRLGHFFTMIFRKDVLINILAKYSHAFMFSFKIQQNMEDYFLDYSPTGIFQETEMFTYLVIHTLIICVCVWVGGGEAREAISFSILIFKYNFV